MTRKIAFLPMLFAAFCLSNATSSAIAEQFPNSDIQWILDQYHVSEPVSLISAEGLAGWTWTNGRQITQARWLNQDGKLVLDRSENTRGLPGGDLVTARQYTNFVLDFSWIASRGANSGIKYRLKNFGPRVEYSETYGWLGCEYQILDDFNRREGTSGDGRWSAASLYYVLAPDSEKKRLNPHGELNTGRIVVLNNRIEHWLNGVKVLQGDVGSDTWNDAIAQSKFAREGARPGEGFGENPTGYILLQDHGNSITFETLVIREIGEKRNDTLSQ